MRFTTIKATVHLFIPRLFQPLIVWQKDFGFEPESPSLSQLLRQFDSVKNHDANCLNDALFAAIGLSNNTELPVAHYRYQAHLNTPNDTSLICADPVHLEVGLTDVTLTHVIDDLTDNEAHELIALLNGHFKQDNIEFIFGSNSQWYISLSSSLPSLSSSSFDEKTLSTQPLETVLRQNIAKALPISIRTTGGRNWQAIQNEIQMLLHTSEVNQQREMAGLSTLNSLWLWGAGEPISENNLVRDTQLVIGEASETNNEGIEGIDEGIQGKSIAKAINCDWQKISDDINWEQNLSSNTMIILDQLITPAINEQPEQYQEALRQLDSQIIKPIMDLWRKDKIELIIDSCDGCLIKPIKLPAWKFWKKPLSLLEHSLEISKKHGKVGGCASTSSISS